MNSPAKIILSLLLLWISQAFADSPADWRTDYEKSNFLETPRYAETIDYCKRLDAASPWLKYSSFGKSPQGRDLPLVIVDKNGNFTPEAVKNSGNVIALIQSGIHSGEIDGKDASLMLMRELVITKKLSHLLDGVTVLFIPIFNVDGHEMMSKFNRINQNGPAEMGFRATAQFLNLNRDFLKADSPEMQAWLGLFNEWLPDFLVDNHVTDGADHQYVLTYGIDTHENVAEPLRRWMKNVMEPFLNQKMSADGFHVMPYFSMKERPDIRNGIMVNEYYSPRYSTGYGGVQNRVFYLVETHALKDYKTRVTGNYHLLIHMLELLKREKEALKRVNRESDELTETQLAGTFLPLNFEQDFSDTTWQDFLGIDYDVRHSEISDGPWVKYKNRPVTIKMPTFANSLARDSVKIPFAYLIPPQWKYQIETLKTHGVEVRYLKTEQLLTVDSYQLNNPRWRSQPFEGHLMLSVDVQPLTEERVFPAGSAVILMNQRTNRLVAALLEPNAPDSFIRWGLWNTIFERKEYGEDYVLEEKARQMLKENTGLRDEFEQALAADSSLAGNRWARLYFFFARTPYWEKHVGKYPVGKLMKAVELPLNK